MRVIQSTVLRSPFRAVASHSVPLSSIIIHTRTRSPAACAVSWTRYNSSESLSKKRLNLWGRIMDFTPAVLRLWNDCLRYHNIHNAMNTPRNVWASRKQPPRRQLEQQRTLKQDWRYVMPTVVLCSLPFVGYFPLVFAVLFPRQLLSRQFHTPYERDLFACWEYKQRQGHYTTLGTYFWNSLSIQASDRHGANFSLMGKGQDEDAAGPVFRDMEFFYHVFFDAAEQQSDSSPQADGILNLFLSSSSNETGASFARDVRDLPRQHLITLAQAVGRNQSLPHPWNWLVTNLEPTFVLRLHLVHLAQDICKDDDALLEEGQHKHKCASLTEEEVREACLLRGLPVTVTADEMRTCLANYLNMIQSLKTHLSRSQQQPHHPGLHQFVLHLSAIRYHLKQESKK